MHPYRPEFGRLERARAQLGRNDNAHALLAGIDRLAAEPFTLSLEELFRPI